MFQIKVVREQHNLACSFLSETSSTYLDDVICNAHFRYDSCSVRESYDRMQSHEHHTWWDIDSFVVDHSNCSKPCQFDEFILERVPYAHPYIPKDWVFSPDTSCVIQIYYVDTVEEVEEEYLAYDVFSLVGEVGGALGLFLGLSLLDIICDLVELAWRKFYWRFKKN